MNETSDDTRKLNYDHFLFDYKLSFEEHDEFL